MNKLTSLNHLISVGNLQKIQDQFSTAFGLPLTIRDLSGNLITKISNPSKLWHYVHKHPDYELKFKPKLNDAIAKCQRTGQVTIFQRYIDTFSFVCPLILNNKISACFVGGLVRIGNPNVSTAKVEAEILNITTDEFLEAYLELPLFTEQRIIAAANLLKILTNTLTSLEFKGNEIAIKKAELAKKNKQLSKNLADTSTALSLTTDKYRRLFESVQDGIYMADLNGNFIEINQAGSKILGFNSPEELANKSVRQVYANPKDRDLFEQIIYSKGYISNFVIKIVTPNGQQKTVETNATLLKDSNNKPLYVEGIFREIQNRQHQPLKTSKHSSNPTNFISNHSQTKT